MNLCTDELLMRLVDPSRIAGITLTHVGTVNPVAGKIRQQQPQDELQRACHCGKQIEFHRRQEIAK